MVNIILPIMIEGSLHVKLPTIWTHGKAKVEMVRMEKRRRERERERERERRSKKMRRKKIGARKSRKVAIHRVFFQWFAVPKGRKVGSAGAGPDGQMRYENCTPLWRETVLEAKMYKPPHVRTTLKFEYWKIVNSKCAKHLCRSTLEIEISRKCTCSSQNVQSTPSSDQFLEGDMSKNCTAAVGAKLTIFLERKTPRKWMDSTLDHSHLATEVQLGENELHIAKSVWHLCQARDKNRYYTGITW